MGAEFLVASLWVVVLVYWLWTRRPASADTIGLFRRELAVLEFASPNRVAPANRLCAEPPASSPVAVATVPVASKRAEIRRRRRDVVIVLVCAVALTLAAAVLTRSVFAFGAQALCDLVLISYICLLARATRAPAQLKAPRADRVPRPEGVAAQVPKMSSSAFSGALAAGPVEEDEDGYVPVHAARGGTRRVAVAGADLIYGDFDSYASLAVAN